jgi:hypothetical protein
MESAQKLRNKFASKIIEKKSISCLQIKPHKNERETLLFPLSMIEKSLRAHPLHTMFNADIIETHECMCALLKEMQETEHTQTPESNSVVRNVPTCALCKSDIFLFDTARGECSCSNCGLVCKSQLNFQNDFTKIDENAKPRRGAYKKEKLIPDWMFHSLNKTVPDNHAEIEYLVEHCNPYVNLTTDTLQRAKRLGKLIKIRSNSLSKVFAAIAVIQLEGKVNWDAVKASVQMGKALVEVSIYERKEALYRCNKCNAPVEERYMIKRHPCGWGKTSKSKKASL